MDANRSAVIEPRNEAMQAGHFGRYEARAHQAKCNLRANCAKLPADFFWTPDMVEGRGYLYAPKLV
jgi:hypothetical protein